MLISIEPDMPKSVVTTAHESRSYRLTPERLWSLMGDPRKLATVVPMLRAFDVNGPFIAGATVSEVHTIGGWPQRYEGRVVLYNPPISWSMTSFPVHRFPWGLPHTVMYRVSPAQKGGEVSIRCSYQRQGLLRFLVPDFIVLFVMRRTLRRLLTHISQVA